VDMLPISFYSQPKRVQGRLLAVGLEAKIQTVTAWFGRMVQVDPRFATGPREVQEYGILGDEQGLATDEPGARGAAWRFHTMMLLRHQAHIERLFHWPVFESVRAGAQTQGPHLLTGAGWLYAVLEHATGSDATLLPVSGAAPGVFCCALYVARTQGGMPLA